MMPSLDITRDHPRSLMVRSGRLLLKILPILYALAATSAGAQGRSTAACGGLAANTVGVRDMAHIDQALEEDILAIAGTAQPLAGLAVGVVRNNTVVYARGFGFKDLERCHPVTPDTPFYLKSVTKSFVGMLAATLHEEGAIELDAPITEYLPELGLPPPIHTSHLTLRSHLTHGITYAHNGLNYRTAYLGNLPENKFVEFLNVYATPKDTRFAYSNLGPIVAAHAMGKRTGQNWREALETRIFAPLGMNSSFAHIAKGELADMAKTYVRDTDGALVHVKTKFEEQMHAAGGTISSVNDMSRWVVANLNNGVLEGEQILPKRAVLQAHARQIQMDWSYRKFRRFAHGLGVYSADYEGDLLMHHFGGESHYSFMPEHDLGVVVLSNQIDIGAYATHAIAAQIYDRLLGKPNLAARRAAAIREIQDRLARRSQRRAEILRDRRASAPNAETVYGADRLGGRYLYDRLGEILIRKETNDTLTAVHGVLSGPLLRVRGNAFLADLNMWGDLPDLWVFRTDPETGAMTLTADDDVFVKQVD